jgi:hypothetical protein
MKTISETGNNSVINIEAEADRLIKNGGTAENCIEILYMLPRKNEFHRKKGLTQAAYQNLYQRKDKGEFNTYKCLALLAPKFYAPAESSEIIKFARQEMEEMVNEQRKIVEKQQRFMGQLQLC